MNAGSSRALRALEVPLLDFIEARPIDSGDPSAGIAVEVTPSTVNAVNALHGGVISTLLDVAAYLAVAQELRPDEEAITHALFVSYQRGARVGDKVKARGRVSGRGRRLAFATAELRTEERLLAAAHVTKSILHSRQDA